MSTRPPQWSLSGWVIATERRGAHALPQQRRQQGPAADIASPRAAAVDQDGAVAVAQQDRIPLADVEHRQLGIVRDRFRP